MIQDHKEYFDENGYVAFNNFIPDEDLAVISDLAESIYASNLKKIGQTKDSGSGEYNKKHIDIGQVGGNGPESPPCIIMPSVKTHIGPEED